MSATPSKPEELVRVQFRPLPWSQILIRAQQQEVSDPQPSLAPRPPWGPHRINEEGAVHWALQRGPSPAGPGRTSSLSPVMAPPPCSPPQHPSHPAPA